MMLLHLLLSVAYDVETPYTLPGLVKSGHVKDIGAPDELAHSEYVDDLFHDRGFPVAGVNNPQSGPHYENHQPPLFYLTEVAVFKLNGGESVWFSPTAQIQARTVNGIIGAGTVAAVFFMAFWATKKPALALFSAAVTALLPMFCALSGAVSNDPMLYLWMSWCLAFLVKGCRGWTWGTALLVGLFAGLAMLTKTTGIILLPLIVIAGFLATPRARWFYVASALLIAIAFNWAWWWRNQQLYHDPLALSVFHQLWPADYHPAEWLRDPRAFAHWGYVLVAGVLLSFIGEFGYMDIHLPYWIYVPLIIVLLSFLFAGLRARIDSRGAWWLILLYTLFVVGAFVQFNLSYRQPQARYIYPAIGPLAIFIGLGVSRVSGRHAKMVGAVVLAALLFANIYALSILPGEFKKRMANVSSYLNEERRSTYLASTSNSKFNLPPG